MSITALNSEVLLNRSIHFTSTKTVTIQSLAEDDVLCNGEIVELDNLHIGMQIIY